MSVICREDKYRAQAAYIWYLEFSGSYERKFRAACSDGFSEIFDERVPVDIRESVRILVTVEAGAGIVL